MKFRKSSRGRLELECRWGMNEHGWYSWTAEQCPITWLLCLPITMAIGNRFNYIMRMISTSHAVVASHHKWYGNEWERQHPHTPRYAVVCPAKPAWASSWLQCDCGHWMGLASLTLDVSAEHRNDMISLYGKFCPTDEWCFIYRTC